MCHICMERYLSLFSVEIDLASIRYFWKKWGPKHRRVSGSKTANSLFLPSPRSHEVGHARDALSRWSFCQINAKSATLTVGLFFSWKPIHVKHQQHTPPSYLLPMHCTLQHVCFLTSPIHHRKATMNHASRTKL